MIPDREKVIKGLEKCLKAINYPDCPKDCPYYEVCTAYNSVVFQPVMRDALELLKEQVKTKVVFQECDGGCETVCGNCGHGLDKTYSRCPKCQRELDWNALQT